METFENTFAVTFNPRVGLVPPKEGRITLNIVLENVRSSHTAAEVLEDMGIHALRVERLT